MDKDNCSCPHHKVGPLVVTLIGLVFLLKNYDVVSASFATMTWPILLIVAGLSKMCKGMCKCCK